MDKISEKGIQTNKSFWNFIKPFMTNKGMIASNNITLIEGKNVITDEYKISQTYNKHYINIVEKSCGKKPNKIGTTLGSLNDSDVLTGLLNHTKTIQVCSKLITSLAQTLLVSIFNK